MTGKDLYKEVKRIFQEAFEGVQDENLGYMLNVVDCLAENLQRLTTEVYDKKRYLINTTDYDDDVVFKIVD